MNKKTMNAGPIERRVGRDQNEAEALDFGSSVLPFFKTKQFMEITTQLYKLNDLIRKAYQDGYKLEVYVAQGDERTGPAPIIQVDQFSHDGKEDSIS